MTQKKDLLIPTIVSRVFDPPIVLSIVTILGILKNNSAYTILLLGAFMPLFIGVPLVYFLWLLKTGKVHNIDVTNRKERIRPLATLLLFLVVDMGIVFWIQNYFLLSLFILYFIWVIGFLLITLAWKISGHTGLITLAVGLLTLWYGYVALPLFLFIPLVAWARVVRHNHTVAQVVAGTVYSLIILAVFSLAVY